MFRSELGRGDLTEIFERSIRDKLEVAPRNVDPTLILVAAQPGAGKTRTVALAERAHEGSMAVMGDDFRQFHPDFARVMREDPLRMPEVTAQAAGAWARMSSDYLRERQASVVFETTFRQPDAVVATAKEFRDAGYRVEVRALAVPEAVSRLGVLSRYAEQVRDQGAGRWTPQAFHDVAAEQMPKSLERVIAEGHVDRVLVVDRAGRTLHAADIDTKAASTAGTRDGADARAAVIAGRNLHSLTPRDANTWLATLDRDANFVLQQADLGSDVLATIDDLRTDATHIAARAHSMQSPAHAEASARLAALGARTSAAREAIGHNEWPPQTGAVEHRAQTPRLTTELATALGHTTGPLADLSPSHTSTRARTQQAPPQHERYER
ncbi:zeta toxin family protein [Pseudoclavibacter sp. VKM Ac-2867]|uniref:zeta toxin family protein n=1 Tax=Pseudoclavibacter sp. VKM Ac-2867 TaxID=2783829 RepID=UPI00188BDB3A|nr:zeta toxin family protein [Pseudoclavibacter sp. VKM Ac-2867]MBF4460817.1 zeta toxin family protein [Pseudoclavibacter sp. VKM Ac-2867]